MSTWAIAVHESAHCVVGSLLGLDVSAVTIAPVGRPDAVGVTTFSGWDEVFASDRIKASLAGPIAERRVSGGGAGWDLSCVSDCGIVAEEMVSGLDLGEMVRAADNLVRRYWRRIEEIAVVLLDRQTLTGAEMREILGR